MYLINFETLSVVNVSKLQRLSIDLLQKKGEKKMKAKCSLINNAIAKLKKKPDIIAKTLRELPNFAPFSLLVALFFEMKLKFPTKNFCFFGNI